MVRAVFVLFSTLFFFGLSPALATNCDVSTCVNICSKGKAGTALQSCNSWCQITIQERKNKGQCKK